MTKDLSIGERIRLYRIMRGYSQAGLAYSAGLTQVQVSNIETNKYKSEASKPMVDAILKALDISEDGLNGFGTNTNASYSSALDLLCDDDRKLIDAFDLDANNLPALLNSMNSLINLCEHYRQKLKECEERDKK